MTRSGGRVRALFRSAWFRTLCGVSATLTVAAAVMIAWPGGSNDADIVQAESDTGRPSAREIAERAGKATVVVRALDGGGRTISEGSGFFVSQDGRVVTNHHVVRSAVSVQIETLGGEVYDVVDLVVADPRRDIVILKVPVDDAQPLQLAVGSEVAVGDVVYVMGNPLGQAGTFSDGLVSSVRTVDGVSLLQITAPVSPGSSGGPVMDTSGSVIGLTTSTLSGGQNLNYAVPTRYIRPLAASTAETRRFAAGVLGSTTPAPASQRGVGGNPQPRAGVAPQVERSSIALEASVDRQIRAVNDRLVPLGWTPVGDPQGGWLEAEGSEELTATLNAGNSYGVVARCDDNCTDVDIYLLSLTGEILASAVEDDDLPAVTLDVSRSGEFRVRVTVWKCETAKCAYGVRLYRTPPP